MSTTRRNFREPKYERSSSYSVSTRLDGNTMRMLDNLMEELAFDSYDGLFTHMIEYSHDMML